ncbi:MAG: asparagine synthase (glutamine-hydrolyzing) [Pirellulaceae bacterium]
MCGITGIIDPALSSDQIDASLHRMNDVIVHRGPDDFGHVIGQGLGIGMRRLSIIDVGGGHQPIDNEAGDIHVVCNGEIYNFVELRKELIAKGHIFSTGSDAEVIVHLYEDLGDECFTQLRGMFGAAIFDRRKHRIVVARDRLGKKPLYYAALGERFWFGSEMKSLLAVEPKLREPDYRTLGHFLQFGFIPEPETIYRHIHQLPAGHLGVHEAGGWSMRPFWELKFDPDEQASEEEWIQRLDAELREATRIRLHSDVPLGVFLSGGLDSSAIVAYAHAAGLNPIKTFTIGFDRAEWDESADALRVAEHYKTDHHMLRISEADLCASFDETLQAIIHHTDQPFGDSSAIPTYAVSRLAREHVTVILSGDGGDELFAGYSSYRGALFAQRYRRLVPSLIGRHVLPNLAQGAAAVLPGNTRYKMLRVAKVLRDSALPFPQAYRDKSSIWRVEQINRLLSSDLIANDSYLGSRYMPERHWRTFMNDDRDVVSRLCEIDVQSYMRDDILVKVDRMSMAHSLEVRSPLLDHKVVELAASMPTGMKIRDGQGKYVLRRLMADKLPARTLRKGKQGFAVPLRDWFRGSLRDLVHDRLNCESGLPSDMFQRGAIERLLREHDKGLVDHSQRIWLLLTFATWHAGYQSGEPFAARTSTTGVA